MVRPPPLLISSPHHCLIISSMNAIIKFINYFLALIIIIHSLNIRTSQVNTSRRKYDKIIITLTIH